MSAMESIAQQQEELEKFFKERDAISKKKAKHDRGYRIRLLRLPKRVINSTFKLSIG
jgi:hypothetical protein